MFALGAQGFMAVTMAASQEKALVFPCSPENLRHKSCGLHLPFTLSDMLLCIRSIRWDAFRFDCFHPVFSNKVMLFDRQDSQLAPTPSLHPWAAGLAQEI